MDMKQIWNIFVDKIPMDWVRTPLLAKISKNPQFFMMTPFWIMWDLPPPFEKNPKKSQFFLIRKFWIRRDPPAPLSEFFSEKNCLFFYASLYLHKGKNHLKHGTGYWCPHDQTDQMYNWRGVWRLSANRRSVIDKNQSILISIKLWSTAEVLNL